VKNDKYTLGNSHFEPKNGGEWKDSVYLAEKTTQKTSKLVFRDMFVCHTVDGPAITWNVTILVNNGRNYQAQLESRISEPSTVFHP